VNTLSTSQREEHQATRTGGTTRLVDYLKARLIVVPSREIGGLITSGFVHIRRDGKAAAGRTFDLLVAGDRIAIDRRALAALETSRRWIVPWETTLQLHHEDEDLLVVEKKAGVHVHPLGARREATLLGALIFHAGARADQPWGEWRPHIVQRLDRAVAGLLLVAKGAAMKDALCRLQQRGELRRRYRTMVVGRVRGNSGTIEEPLGRDPECNYRRGPLSIECGGQRAVTRWTVVERFEDRTLLDVEPFTGRTHQIRAHMTGIGHPIVGDVLYSFASVSARSRKATVPGPTDPTVSERSESEAIALHAVEIAFRHPRSGAERCFQSSLPVRFGHTWKGSG